MFFYTLSRFLLASAYSFICFIYKSLQSPPTLFEFSTRDFILELAVLNISHWPFFKSHEDGVLQKEEQGQEEDTDGEKEPEQEHEETGEEETEEQQEEDHEVMREEREQEKQQKDDDDECAEHPECASLGFRESDGEKSLDLPDSPRPLSQETRNLTASELLLNKLVNTRKLLIENKIRAVMFCFVRGTSC